MSPSVPEMESKVYLAFFVLFSPDVVTFAEKIRNEKKNRNCRGKLGSSEALKKELGEMLFPQLTIK